MIHTDRGWDREETLSLPLLRSFLLPGTPFQTSLTLPGSTPLSFSHS